MNKENRTKTADVFMLNKNLLNSIKQSLNHHKIKHIIKNNLIIAYCPKGVVNNQKIIEHYVIFSEGGYLFFKLDSPGVPEIVIFPFNEDGNDISLSSVQYGKKIIFNKENDFVDKRRMDKLMVVLNNPEVRKRGGGVLKNEEEEVKMIINKVKSEIEAGLIKANIDYNLIKNKTTNTKHKI